MVLERLHLDVVDVELHALERSPHAVRRELRDGLVARAGLARDGGWGGGDDAGRIVVLLVVVAERTPDGLVSKARTRSQ